MSAFSKTDKFFLRWLFIIYLAGIACVAFSSCKATKPESSETKLVEKSETITKTETLKIDTVQVAADSSKIEGQLQVDPITKKIKPFKAQSGGKRAKATAEVDSAGNLKVKCNCEAEQALIVSKDTQIETLKAQAEKSESVKTVPIPYTAWYDRLARVVALLLTACNLIALIIYLLYRYRRKIYTS